MRFTRQSITGLTPPPGKPYIIFWDEALAGFGLRINEGGSRMWVVQYRVAGKTKRETLGRMNTISLDEARKRAKETLARVHLGSDPHAEKKEAEARAAITFERIVERYLKQTKARLKPRSYMEVERHLNRHWAPLNGTPIHKINRAWVAVDLGEIAEENGPFASRSTNSADAIESEGRIFQVIRGSVKSNAEQPEPPRRPPESFSVARWRQRIASA